MNFTIELKSREFKLELYQSYPHKLYIHTYYFDNDIKSQTSSYQWIPPKIEKLGYDAFRLVYNDRAFLYKLTYNQKIRQYSISRLHVDNCSDIEWLGRYNLGCYTKVKDSKIVIYDASSAITTKIDIKNFSCKSHARVQYLTRNIFLIYKLLERQYLIINNKGIIKKVINRNNDDYYTFYPLFGDYCINYNHNHCRFDIYKVENDDIVLYQYIYEDNPINTDYYFTYDKDGLLNVCRGLGGIYSLEFDKGKFYLQDPSCDLLAPSSIYFTSFEDIYVELKDAMVELNLHIQLLPLIFSYLKFEQDIYTD